MQTVFQPIKLACETVGGQAALARAVGVSPAFVSQWLYSRRQVPFELCPAVEQATKRKVTCEELRPDVDWDYLSRRKQKVPA
jgi:DNA-binding transcriptional regulator YdaS (Cro superfamily)